MNSAPSLTHSLDTLSELFLVVRLEDYCQTGSVAVSPRRDSACLCLLLISGQAQVSVAHEHYVVPANSLVFMPAGQIFACQFDQAAAGYLCRIDIALLQERATTEKLQVGPGGAPLVALDGAVTGHLQKVMERVLSLYRLESLPPVGLLQSYVAIILVEAQHANQSALAAPISAARQLTTAFRQLLASRITHTHHASTYAAWLRVTPNHLSRVVKMTMGKSPQAWLYEALMLEAQLLLQTDLSIAEVAHQVGLANSSHFSRLFKKVTGHRPGQWRIDCGRNTTN